MATGRRRVLVIHGPNLNLLGVREPEIYGHTTLADIDAGLVARGAAANADVDCFQSNHEGEIVTRIQHARAAYDAIVINAASYTHTSIAIRDALEAVKLPAVEVHMSNVHKREAFRQVSTISAVCVGLVLGFGAASYTIALDAVLAHVLKSEAV